MLSCPTMIRWVEIPLTHKSIDASMNTIDISKLSLNICVELLPTYFDTLKSIFFVYIVDMLLIRLMFSNFIMCMNVGEICPLSIYINAFIFFWWVRWWLSASLILCICGQIIVWCCTFLNCCNLLFRNNILFCDWIFLCAVNKWISKLIARATEKMMKQKDER
jgi:hypothetical protein